MKLKAIRAFAALTLALCSAGLAQAQTAYPNKVVKIVVPALAGGSPDSMARLLGERLSAKWGQPVVIDNKPGAGGALGAQTLKAAAADGHTFMMGFSSLVQLPHLLPSVPYDVLKDFTPVAHLGGTHLALLVNGDVPVNNVAEFVAYAKARDGQLNYASYGAGSLSHFLGEAFNSNAGVKLTHVAYKGDAPALMDLMQGRVQAAVLSVFFVRQHLASGKVKVLGVTGSTRSPLMPEVPTMEEAGVKGMSAQGWFGLFAPAGLPPAIQEKVATDVREVLAMPETKAKLLESGIVAGGGDAAAFARQVRQDFELYGDMARQYKISLN